MATPGKHNISRNLWRFLEISLFFLVSVLGHNVLAKTSSFNAKSKSKEHSSRVVTVQPFLDEDTLMLYSFQEQSADSKSFHTNKPFYSVFHQQSGCFTPHFRAIPARVHIASSSPFVTKLFLQNQVLII